MATVKLSKKQLEKLNKVLSLADEVELAANEIGSNGSVQHDDVKTLLYIVSEKEMRNLDVAINKMYTKLHNFITQETLVSGGEVNK